MLSLAFFVGFVVVRLRFCGEKSVFVYFGGLFNTLIFLKNLAILWRYVFVDLEKACFSVIVCEAYMLFRSLLKAGQSHSR